MAGGNSVGENKESKNSSAQVFATKFLSGGLAASIAEACKNARTPDFIMIRFS